MKIGIGQIPATWPRMFKFRKIIMADKSPSSRLRCYEKGADIIEALCGLCALNNFQMRPWQELIMQRYKIDASMLLEIKATIGLLGSSVRDLYQCSGLAPLDFLDFLYGDAQVIYEEMESDGDLEDDTGSDEIRLRYFGPKKTVKTFSQIKEVAKGWLLEAFWFGSFGANSWFHFDDLDAMEVTEGEVKLSVVYRNEPSDGYTRFYHCTNPIAMRHIAQSGFRNTQDVELTYPPGVYGAVMESDAAGYLHFLYADGVWAAAVVEGGFATRQRMTCKRVMSSGQKQVSDVCV